MYGGTNGTLRLYNLAKLCHMYNWSSREKRNCAIKSMFRYIRTKLRPHANRFSIRHHSHRTQGMLKIYRGALRRGFWCGRINISRSHWTGVVAALVPGLISRKGSWSSLIEVRVERTCCRRCPSDRGMKESWWVTLSVYSHFTTTKMQFCHLRPNKDSHHGRCSSNRMFSFRARTMPSPIKMV